MRGRYGQPSRWTPERIAEAIQEGWAAVQLAPGRRPTLDVIRYESGAAYWGGQRI